MNGQPLDPSIRQAYELGGLYAELNTILAKLRRREPTQRERDRIAALQGWIRDVKRTGTHAAHDLTGDAERGTP